MSTPTGPAAGLPVRMPRPRQPGRHRRPEPPAAPQGAPALVLAVPGTPGPAVRSLAEETLSIARSELPGLDARIAYLDGAGDEFPALGSVLARTAAERAARAAAAREAAAARAADAEGAGPADGTEGVESGRSTESGPWAGAATDGPVAVVVPLLASPHPELMARIRREVVDSGIAAELTDVLGPHPLLAEAVHVRLSEAGLARADRARLFTVTTAADGIVLGTVGGEEAAQAAGITGMLLAARLAVPVLAAALDVEGSVARAAAQLRAAGSTQLALAPCVIGPEAAEGLLKAAADEAGCPFAEELGAYPTIGKLVLSLYASLLGIAPQTAAPMR
ncbi:hypothetical protein [Streptomyces sp. URMC 123]|uniref:hypothetical protein n=1 Tax=Streptomyces sp. URMC 123 TaxID=3423403 RepID=UPI003F1C235E